MQYTVRNRRRLKQTGSTPALTVTAPGQLKRTVASTNGVASAGGVARSVVPTVEAWLAVTTLERARE